MKRKYKDLGERLKEWRAINKSHKNDPYGGYCELYYDLDEDKFSIEEFASRDGYIRFDGNMRIVRVEDEMYEYDMEKGGWMWNGETSYKMSAAYIKKFLNEHMDFVIKRHGWEEI